MAKAFCALRWAFFWLRGAVFGLDLSDLALWNEPLEMRGGMAELRNCGCGRRRWSCTSTLTR